MTSQPGSEAICRSIPTITILSYLIPKLFIFLIAIGSSMTIYMILIFNFQTQQKFDQLILMPENHRHSEPTKRPFHVAMTASKGLYGKWQCRVAYYWYKKVRDLPGSDMGGFTRILHSGESDDLMDEIPTFVVKPLPSNQEHGYVVLNRPWAFVQWLQKAEIEEEYVLMAEPDHLFVKPMPNLAHGPFPAAFKFLYIVPEMNEEIIRKYYPMESGPVTFVDPIGNSPAIIKKSVLQKIAPPPGVPETVVQLVQMINEATANIPDWDSLDDGN